MPYLIRKSFNESLCSSALTLLLAFTSINQTKEVYMNRIFTLFSFLVLSLSVFAYDNVRLSISSMTNKPLRVMINGQRINQMDGNIRISHLNPGYHRIQIYRAVANQRRRFGNQQQNQQGQLIYNGTVNIRNGMHTDIIINRFGRVFTDEQPIDDRFDDDWNRDDRWNNNDNRYGNNLGQTMSNDRFQQLKQAVEREHFDDNKLDLLKSVLPNNLVSTAQVRELAQLFSFEQNKLEFAKFAYKFTYDRGNYFLVNDVFHFGTSKTELTRYIAGYRD
jgi:hypothetical protein